MYGLSIYLIQIQSYRAFSNITVDHWCLSLSTKKWCIWTHACYFYFLLYEGRPPLTLLGDPTNYIKNLYSNYCPSYNISSSYTLYFWKIRGYLKKTFCKLKKKRKKKKKKKAHVCVQIHLWLHPWWFRDVPVASSVRQNVGGR